METGKVINRISNRLRRRSAALQETLGMSGAQGNILNFILVEGQKHSIYQKDIEKYFGICRSALTNIIQTLEKKGYICRASVANDARLKKVMLTEKGRENHEKLGEIFQKMDAQLEEGITEGELHAFMHVIDKVYYNMEKMKGENS